MKLTTRSPGCRQAGFTIIEILIGSLIGLIALAGMTNFLYVGMNTSQVTSAQSQLDAKSIRVLQQISRELTYANFTSILPKDSPPLSSSILEYRSALGHQNGEIVWGPNMRIALQDSPRDPADGADNDGDGFIDEKRIVLITNVGQSDERTRVLATGVAAMLQGETENTNDDNGNGLLDEEGLCFTFDGSAIHIRLTLQQLGPGQQAFFHTVETAVVPRN